MEASEFVDLIKVDDKEQKSDFEKKIVRIQQRFKTDKSRCRIVFKVTAVCNYTCDYCCNLPGEEDLRTDIERMRKFLPYIKDIPHDKVFYYMFGGEPTLNRGLKDICLDLGRETIAQGKELKILIQTNGFWSVKKFEEFCEDIPKDWDLRFAISYHPTQTTAAQIMKVSRWLMNNDRFDGINVLFSKMDEGPRLEKEIKMFRRFFGKEAIQLMPTFQIADAAQKSELYHSIEKTEPDVKITYKEDGEEKVRLINFIDLIGEKILHYEGMMCGDGVAVLDTDGYIYKCWSAYAEKDRVLNYINTDYDEYNREKFRKVIGEPILCKYKTCVCEIFNDKWVLDER